MSFAQLAELGANPQSFVQASPDVASLGTYGFLKPSLYTGAASYAIDLYEIDFDGLKLPIRLTYNSSGLLVERQASWVGLDWDLTAQGVITRTVQDADDFLQEVNQVAGTKNGWIYQPDFEPLIENNPTALYYPSNLIMAISNTDQPSQKPDTEPDIFTANIFGRTFSFILGKKGSGDLVNGRLMDLPTYRVEFSESSKTFIITDDQGFKYFFNNKEYSNIYEGYFQADIITGWFVTRIESPRGRSMTFEYVSSGTQMGIVTNGPGVDALRNTVEYYIEEFGNQSAQCDAQVVAPGPIASEFYNENSVNYLAKIINGREEINFLMSPREDIQTKNNISAAKLNGIQIRFDGDLKVAIEFTNSYFNQHMIGASDAYNYLRLKLDEVNVSDRKYRFTYNSTNLLPTKDSKAKDIWGFYNGKIMNTTLMPKNSKTTSRGTVSIGGADRDADSAYSDIGMLRQITYPTGGYSRFSYEGNSVKLDYNKQYGWERQPSTGSATSNTSTTEQKTFTFTLPVATTFSALPSALASLQFSIQRTGQPFDVYNAVDARRDLVAMELRGPSDNLIKAVKYGEFNTFCYADPNAYICDLNDNSNYCYCYQSRSFYEGTLPAGTYTIRLMPAIAFQVNGVDYTLHPVISARYPTGGYRDKIVGGQRVTSLIDYEKDGSVLSKRVFSYADNSGYSSGKLMSEPMLAVLRQRNATATHDTDIGESCSACTRRLSYVEFSSNSYNSQPKGPHIGYSEVTESYVSVDHPTDNYKTKTVFYNSANTELSYIPNSIIFACYDFVADYLEDLQCGKGISYEKRNGQPLTISHYNNLNQIVSLTENSYQSVTRDRFAATRFMARNASYFTTTNDRVGAFVNYFLEQSNYLPVTTTTTTITSKGNTVATDNFTYDSNWYARTKSLTNSDGHTTVTTNYYPSDYTILPDLISKNILGSPVKQTVTDNGVLTRGVVLDYTPSGLLSNTYVYESKALTGPAAHASDDLVPDNYNLVTAYSYTSTSKVKQYVDRTGVPVTLLWGYDERFVVAEIRGIDHATLAALYTVNQGLLNNPYSEAALLQELTNVRNAVAAKNALVTTYTFNPLVGLTTVTDSNGRKSRFNYDSSGRLESVVDHDGNIVKEYQYNLETTN